MPIYVIHIGPPKAGSKNLQSSLHSVRSHLAAQGIYTQANGAISITPDF